MKHNNLLLLKHNWPMPFSSPGEKHNTLLPLETWLASLSFYAVGCMAEALHTAEHFRYPVSPKNKT